jgi:phenol 2-monooxygenase
MSGVGIDYSQSLLTLKSSKQHLASGIPLGKRFPSTQVSRQSGGQASELHTLLPSTGHFRIVIFGGDISQPGLLQRVNKLGYYLNLNISPKYTKISPRKSCPIELLLVHCAPRASVRLLEDLEDAYHPFYEELGYDYDRVFFDGVSSGEVEGKAYGTYKVQKEKGCVVIVRPDQFVSWIGELEDVEEMDKFFDDILVELR